jgi:hypothetical protein
MPAPKLDVQLDPFQFDNSSTALDPLLDSYPISSTTHLPYPDGFLPHDLDPDSFFTQSQLPFFEPFTQPYDPPPSGDKSATDPYPPTDVPMESGQYYIQPRPPIEAAQGVVDDPADWNFPPNAFDGLLDLQPEGCAVKTETENAVAGLMARQGPPSGLANGHGEGGPFSVHPIGETPSSSARKRARSSEEPEKMDTPQQTPGATAVDSGKGKDKEGEKKKEKRKPSPYNS